MASTFSPTLRLELIGDGDQSGIWGQTTNTNLGTLLEQAITGVVTVTMADANYTLTNFNGVSDEARNAVLVVGGTNAAVRDIITPLAEKLYVVKNSTVGGFAINVRAASGSSVSVPSGATVWVYCDGTNFNAINTESVGNFEVNGNLTVTGTTSLASALTYGGVALSNSVTGTGSMALSASPTFTGAPLAPTASPGTNTTQIATTAFVAASTGTLGTMSTQNANNVAITGGTINGTTVGATTAGTVRGTTVTATSQFSGPGTGLTGSASSLSIGGSAATVGLSQFASSLGSSGYQYLPSGFIIQWGFAAPGWGSGDAISFPIAFPNNCFCVNATGQGSSTPSTNNIAIITILNTSSFAFYANATTGQYWMAFGN
jgi:hypothetical protein